MSRWNITEHRNQNNSSLKISGGLAGMETLTSKVLKTMALGVLMLMSLLGNSLIIACVVRNKNRRMRTVSNLLIVNTSIAYLLITLVNVPELMYYVNATKNPSFMGGKLGLHLCRLMLFAPFLSVTLSTQSFAILAVDRFIAVFYPIRRITHKTAYVLIALTWLNSFIFGGVYLYGTFVLVHPSTGDAMCVMSIQKTFHGIKGLVTFVWIEFSVFYIFPLVIAGILYTATIIRLWRPKLRQRATERGSLSIRYSDRTNQNAIKMLVTVLVLFTLAWLPMWVYTVICRGNPKAFLRHPICTSRVFWFLRLFIGYCHSAMAPYVYPAFSQNFRSGFKDCLPCLQTLCSVNMHINSRISSLELKTVRTPKERSRVTALSIQWIREQGSPGTSERHI